MPIEKLSERGGSQALYDAWRSTKSRLQLAEFNNRLTRRFSIETGILERLYDLDRGTTEALVATGFLEDLVSRKSTNIEPCQIMVLRCLTWVEPPVKVWRLRASTQGSSARSAVKMAAGGKRVKPNATAVRFIVLTPSKQRGAVSLCRVICSLRRPTQKHFFPLRLLPN